VFGAMHLCYSFHAPLLLGKRFPFAFVRGDPPSGLVGCSGNFKNAKCFVSGECIGRFERNEKTFEAGGGGVVPPGVAGASCKKWLFFGDSNRWPLITGKNWGNVWKLKVLVIEGFP